MRNFLKYFGLEARKANIFFALTATLLVSLIIVWGIAQTSNSSAAPDLTGMTVAQANDFADKNGVLVSYVWVDSNEEQGTVILQEPAFGESIPLGKAIKLIVSKGVKNNSSNSEQKTNSTSDSVEAENPTQNKQTPPNKSQSNQSPVAGNNAPAPANAPKVTPPDPTRPWLTQQDIDQNRAEKAQLQQQIASLVAVIAGIQQCVNESAYDMQRYRVGGPEDNMTLWADAMQRNSNCRYELDSKNSELNVYNSLLNSRQWY